MVLAFWTFFGFVAVIVVGLFAAKRRPSLRKDFPIAKAIEFSGWVYPLVVWIFLQALLTPLLQYLGLKGLDGVGWSCLIANLTFIFLTTFALTFLSKVDRNRYGLTLHQWPRNLILGIQMGLVISVLNFLSLKVSTELAVHFTASDTIEAWLHNCHTSSGLLFRLIVVALGAPIAEELLFRAAVYSGLRPFIGPWPAALFSSCLFAALHGFSPLSLRFYFLFAFALLWVRCRERTGSLIGPIVAHAMLNLSIVAGGWCEGLLLTKLSWSKLGWLYLALSCWYLVSMTIKSRGRLEHALAQQSFLIVPLAGPAQLNSQGPTSKIPALICPACNSVTGTLGVEVERCSQCCYPFKQQGRLASFIQVLGLIVLVGTASLSFFMGSDRVQQSSFYLNVKVTQLGASGRQREAIELLERHLAKNPKDFSLYGDLSVMHYHSGNYEKALEAAQKLRDKVPGDSTALHYFNLEALCLVDSGGDLDEALRAAQKALELTPKESLDRPSVEDTLGWVYFHRKDYKKAAQYIEGALKKIPYANRLAAYELKYHLGLVRLEEGREEEGRELLQWVAKGNGKNRFVKAARKALDEHGL